MSPFAEPATAVGIASADFLQCNGEVMMAGRISCVDREVSLLGAEADMLLASSFGALRDAVAVGASKTSHLEVLLQQPVYNVYDRASALREGGGARERHVRKSQLTDDTVCLLYTSPSPRDLSTSRMPSSA